MTHRLLLLRGFAIALNGLAAGFNLCVLGANLSSIPVMSGALLVINSVTAAWLTIDMADRMRPPVEGGGQP